MATPTYTPLANVTLGAAASTVTFGSIPNTFRDLIIVTNGTGSTTFEARLRFNGDTNSRYTVQNLSGDGSTARSGAPSSATSAFISVIPKATTTSPIQITTSIFEYATTKAKIHISRADNGQNGTEVSIHRYLVDNNSTPAITSVQILTSTGNWAAGSTFALYGVIA